MADSSSRVADDGGISVAERFRNIKDASTEKIKQGLDASRESIQANPLKSVLIAFGVGALVVVLLARRGGDR